MIATSPRFPPIEGRPALRKGWNRGLAERQPLFGSSISLPATQLRINNSSRFRAGRFVFLYVTEEMGRTLTSNEIG